MSTIPDRLAAWREAERQWEMLAPDDPAFAAARNSVLTAWAAYHEAAGTFGDEEIVLVVDNATRYVWVNDVAERLLGYERGELVGKSISDVTPGEDLEELASTWGRFYRDGRLDGDYTLRAQDGSLLHTRFAARAHFPVAGIHTSRLRVITRSHAR